MKAQRSGSETVSGSSSGPGCVRWCACVRACVRACMRACVRVCRWCGVGAVCRGGEEAQDRPLEAARLCDVRVDVERVVVARQPVQLRLA